MIDYSNGPDTARLKHRAYRTEDAHAFFELNSNRDVMRYTHEPLLSSIEDAKQAIENYRDFKEVGYGRWACILKSTGRPIGFCGLKFLHDLGEVDLGYRFLPEYWGQGLATESSIASLEFGFHTLRLERIIGLVLPANAGSIRVLQKVGMEFQCKFEYDNTQVLRYSIDRSRYEESTTK